MRTINAWTQEGIKSSQWSFRPQHFPSSLESWDALACNTKESIGKKKCESRRNQRSMTFQCIAMVNRWLLGYFVFFLIRQMTMILLPNAIKRLLFQIMSENSFERRCKPNQSHNETAELWKWTISQDECEVCVQCTYMNGRVRYSIPFPAMFNNKYTAELVSKKTT